jgi:hypothetical protein
MLQQIQTWLAKPFASDQDAWHWFLFIGLLIVIAAVWHLVLRHIYS